MSATRRPYPDFLIISAPRSGSTLLARMLDMHSRIQVPDETGFLLYAFGVDRRFKQRISGFHRLQVFQDGPSPPRNTFFPTPADFFDAFVSHYRTTDNQLLGEKTPAHWYFLRTAIELLPATRILFLSRNPISMVSSCLQAGVTMFPFVTLPGERLSAALAPALVWQAAAREMIPIRDDPRVLPIRYEDLVSNPQRILDRVCNHLAVEFEPEMLDFHRSDRLIAGRPAASFPHHRNLSRPVFADRIRARECLDDAQVAAIEHALAEEMRAMDYTVPKSQPPPGFAQALKKTRRHFDRSLTRRRNRERLKELLSTIGLP